MRGRIGGAGAQAAEGEEFGAGARRGSEVVFVGVEGEGEKGRSHCWISVQARSLTALWMGIMEGMVWARVEVFEGDVGLGWGVVERASGLCLRRTAVKNWCSEG